ncbi:nucleoside-diphosphate kinase [Candidatus Peregrinibacteria bacterium]|nr:nucleoside-diphosphate kinase [Candidatus Peregrinibacteria bacterium]
MERTLVLIKPDGVERGHTGDILSRFERTGLKIAGMKMVWPKKDDVDRHYTLTDEWMQGVFTKAKQKYDALGQHFPYGDAKTYGAAIKTGLMDFLQSGPVVAMVLEGEQSVALVRKLVGATEPASAAPGTIRGDFSLDSYALSNSQNRQLRNLIHASGTCEEAQNEIAIWFTAAELHDYPHSLTNILYDPLHFTPKKRPKGS